MSCLGIIGVIFRGFDWLLGLEFPKTVSLRVTDLSEIQGFFRGLMFLIEFLTRKIAF